MNNRIVVFSLLLMSLLSSGHTTRTTDLTKSKAIKISWVEEFRSDFSFAYKWSYPEGVIKNEFGQLSCDGICPQGVERMKDSNGKILEDSLTAFYKLVDTTHLKKSLQAKAWTYEWAGTDYIYVKKISDKVYKGVTLTNAATHSRLVMDINGDLCTSQIELNSVSPSGQQIFYCTGGYIMINRQLLAIGFLQAEFKFTFEHKENPGQPMFWEGKIYAEIDSKDFNLK